MREQPFLYVAKIPGINDAYLEYLLNDNPCEGEGAGDYFLRKDFKPFAEEVGSKDSLYIKRELDRSWDPKPYISNNEKEKYDK